MTRFAVVPLVVDPKATGLTLGDFPNTPRTEVEKRWRVVRDFGRGVYFLQPR